MPEMLVGCPGHELPELEPWDLRRIRDSGVQEIFPSLHDDPDGNGIRRGLIMFGVGRTLHG
jgi:hypothetical protein